MWLFYGKVELVVTSRGAGHWSLADRGVKAEGAAAHERGSLEHGGEEVGRGGWPERPCTSAERREAEVTGMSGVACVARLAGWVARWLSG